MSATDAFLQETLEGLQSLEDTLLELEDTPSKDKIDAVFRTLHTIKGSGAMFGFGPLAEFTHHFESAFERVRNAEIELTSDLISTALEARDHMLSLLESNHDADLITTLQSSAKAVDLENRIRKFLTEEAQKSSSLAVTQPGRERPEAPQPKTFKIRYTPDPTSIKNGQRPDLLIDELDEMGDLQATIDASHIPLLSELDPHIMYLRWDVRLTTCATTEDIEGVFMFLDEHEYHVEKVHENPPKAALNKEKQPEPTQQPTTSKSAKPEKSATVRVPAARLDDLMDQLGELVIAQTRLEQIGTTSGDTETLAVSEELGRLITGLRDSTLAMRMLPIEVVFGKFRRVVRNLSEELAKDVALVTSGGDTELDKTVIDSLTEPLVHMIRNALDHGIETAETRAKTAKPVRATVGLVAEQSGSEVLIRVTDDGGGLDAEAIRMRAIDRGLLKAEDSPTLDSLHRLIFEPAFSTAQEVSSISGRGVGMDAVRRVVNDLRGSIDIDTKKGIGTTITLRLPVTLAIIEGFLVRVGDSIFVLPLSAVRECVEYSTVENERSSGRSMLRIRQELVPFIKLQDVFDIEGHPEKDRRVVIVGDGDARVGLVVDDVLGQHQTVIKTFSIFHRGIRGFAGSTILGNGQVALIVDVAALIKHAKDHATPKAREVA